MTIPTNPTPNENRSSSLASPKGLQETPSVLDAALEYLRLGFSVIPLSIYPDPDEPGKVKKVPALLSWTEYQKRRATEEEIRAWFDGKDGLGVGIVTGRLSGIMVADFDGAEGERILQEKDLALTPMARTGSGGYHVLFRYPNGEEIRNHTRVLPGVDIRGEGGFIAAAPSAYPGGKRYTWEHSPDSVPLADPPAWLLEEIRRKNHGEEQDRGPRINPVSILQGVPEGQRDDSLFRYACRLRTQGIAIEEARILILEAAKNSEPPFPENEALAKVNQAFKYSAPEEKKADPRKVVYEIRGVKDISEYPDPSYLIDPLLVKGTVTVLGAWSGVGKSILALSIMKSVLTGELLWGKYPVLESGPVLLVDEETPAGWLKERVQKAGITADLPFYAIHFQDVRIDEDAHFDALMEAIEKVRPKLLVIDSLIRVHRKKESDAGEMAQVMARLRQIANAGLVVFPIHHHKKGDGPLAEKMRGSSDILGGIDVEFAAVRGKMKGEIRLSSGKTRMAPLEPINLRLTFGETENTVTYMGTEDEEILELLKDIIEGEEFWKLKEIHEHLSGSKKEPVGIHRLRGLLADAGAKGKIEARRGSGRSHGLEYRYFP